jgi:hypothetical protein
MLALADYIEGCARSQAEANEVVVGKVPVTNSGSVALINSTSCAPIISCASRFGWDWHLHKHEKTASLLDPMVLCLHPACSVHSANQLMGKTHISIFFLACIHRLYVQLLSTMGHASNITAHQFPAMLVQQPS